jgi:inosine-uridine nucleoside N-ribohydrolase
MTKIPVILDTDIGTDIDDTWALAMLLNCPELDPWLILTASGDTVYRAHLTAKFLQVAQRTDIPIGIGVGEPEGCLRFQRPWLDGFDVAAYTGCIHNNGIAAMIDLIMASPQPVTIISIAAATNIALALQQKPEIAQRCRFIGMHGSIHLGYGGTTGAVAEANVIGDVNALRSVFAALWLEKMITPLDTCGLVVLNGDLYQTIYHSQNPVLQALIENYRIWAGLVTWSWGASESVDQHSSVLFDTVAVYMAYSQALLEMETVSVRITDDGMTVLDPSGYELRAALRWKDLNAFNRHLVERLQLFEKQG